MNNRRRIVIVGATSAIAEHCARLWIASQPADLILIGRDEQRLERVAADLRVRSPQSAIRILQADFHDPAAIQATVDRVFAPGDVDIVLIAHGSLPDQTYCENNLQACREALEINGVSPVLYAEAFAMHMTKAKHGAIALVGSVAGDRGRKSNYIYGSAKSLVARYAQGLQHRLAGTGVRVLLIKPGPTDTPMTASLKLKGAKMAPVEIVAGDIVKALKRNDIVLYTPRRWRLIMLVVRHLPSIIFNKTNI